MLKRYLRIVCKDWYFILNVWYCIKLLCFWCLDASDAYQNSNLI
jgi:hypothetical protein